MAALLTAAGGLGKVAAIGGTILSGIGSIAAGNAANANAQYEARQLEQRATAERAAAQQESLKDRREKDLVLSRARAVGAASGGGIDINLMGKIEEEGERNALTALWEGEERARGAENQAAATRASGKRAKRAGFIGAGSTILTNTSTLLEKYG